MWNTNCTAIYFIAWKHAQGLVLQAWNAPTIHSPHIKDTWITNFRPT